MARGARAHARAHTDRERGGVPGPWDPGPGPPLSLYRCVPSIYRRVRVRSCTAGQVTSVKNRFRYDLWAPRVFLRYTLHGKASNACKRRRNSRKRVEMHAKGVEIHGKASEFMQKIIEIHEKSSKSTEKRRNSWKSVEIHATSVEYHAKSVEIHGKASNLRNSLPGQTRAKQIRKLASRCSPRLLFLTKLFLTKGGVYLFTINL